MKMFRIIFVSSVFMFVSVLCHAQSVIPVKNVISLTEVADAVIERGEKFVSIENYQGLLYLQSMAEFAMATKSDELMSEVRAIVKDFEEGKRVGYGSFICYHTGGNVVPLLALNGFDDLKPLARETAAKMWKEQPKNLDGHMVPDTWYMQNNPIFIDCVLAVTSYMLYAGLIENNQEYIDYAVWMVTSIWDILYDPDSKLIHQARGCKGHPAGYITEDCWSRGNGWLSHALATLLKYLPKNHAQRKTIENISRKYFTAVFEYQDAEGLWHQEMTWKDSYVEISGSALLLYGIGEALDSGVLPKKYMKPFKKGLEGMLKYVDMKGNVANTCSGCLAYLNGTKADYDSHAYYTNEPHAFGPVILAIAKAYELGIKTIDVDFEPGCSFVDRIPACHVRFISERKEDIAWENDKVAFRVYSREVKGKAGSGVDFWTKSVDEPIIETWYALNAAGQNYHTDRGQGYDFYSVGNNRGIGGTGIWADSSLVVSEPYANYRIYSDDPELLDFEISYQPYTAGGRTIYEKKRIRMVLSTNFYQVTSTIETSDGEDAVLAVGVTDFGNGKLSQDAEAGMLTLIEKISEKDGSIVSSVIADPKAVNSFASYGKDRLVLLNVKSGEPVTYYVGAAWDGDSRFEPIEWKWSQYMNGVSWNILEELYK